LRNLWEVDEGETQRKGYGRENQRGGGEGVYSQKKKKKPSSLGWKIKRVKSIRKKGFHNEKPSAPQDSKATDRES